MGDSPLRFKTWPRFVAIMVCFMEVGLVIFTFFAFWPSLNGRE